MGVDKIQAEFWGCRNLGGEFIVLCCLECGDCEVTYLLEFCKDLFTTCHGERNQMVREARESKLC